MNQADTYRLLAPFVAAGSIFVASKAINSGYRAFTGTTPPRADDLSHSTMRVVMFAAGTAAVSALINTAIQRSVAKAAYRSELREAAGLAD